MGHKTKKMPPQTGWRNPSRAHKTKLHHVKAEREQRKEFFAWRRDQSRRAREGGDSE